MERFPCQPSEECKFFDRGCREDTHHIYYPKKLYKDPVGRIFRELPEHKIQICRQEHDTIHATERPPQRPGREEMLNAIGRVVMGGDHAEENIQCE